MKKKLQDFAEFLKIVRGKADIREKMAFLFQPSDIRTASRLSAGQVDFIADSYFIVQYFPEFQPLKDLAIEIATSMVSHKGERVNEAIQYERAAAKTGMPAFSFQQMFEKDGKKAKKVKESES